MKRHKRGSKTEGLSLIETILYLALFSTLMIVVIPLLFDLIDWQSKQKQIDASIQNQIFLESRIRSLLSGSQSIIEPARNATSSRLIVESAAGDEIKLFFSVNDGLTLEYENENLISLFASTTSISNLTFFRSRDETFEKLHWSATVDELYIGTSTYLIDHE